MGKTAVVTALVLANPRDVKPISNAAFARLLDEAYNTPTLEFKATIVVVNNTLVKQWADEIGKFAPGLNVHVYYASASSRSARCASCASATCSSPRRT